jgi:hypothetical protein
MNKFALPTALGLCFVQSIGNSAVAETMAVRNEPVTVFMVVIKWGRDTSRAAVVAESRIENRNGFPVTDVEVECVHTTLQAVVLSQISKILSQRVIGPKAAMQIGDFNTGFVLEDGQRIRCRVAQFTKYSSAPSEQQHAAVGASPNAHSRKYLAMSATAQLAFWTSYLQKGGVNCDGATRTMFQGGIAGLDHWNIACSNRNEFFVGIDDNDEGTSSILSCRSMRCWVKY